MHESEDATGIDTRFQPQPGMKDAREKLQWASMRDTTMPEDIVSSLSGIFGVYIPLIHGENKQRALGQLLQEIVAQSGDITVLDWVGQSSEFNSCLPADVASYAAPPRVLPSLSEDEIQTAVSSLQDVVAVDLALKLYTRLECLSTARFAHYRLQLPCITFRVTEVRRRRGLAQETPFTYEVKADGLHDLLITSEQTLIQFSRARPTRQTFLLVRLWDRRLLELPDFGDDTEGEESEDDYCSAPGSPLDEPHDSSPVEQQLVDLDSHSRALRLILRLGQPFSAFLLAQQHGAEYKRIASNHAIIAQVKDMASVQSMMDIRTLEIL
ncbi:hypothetical protein EDB19DRAFT_628512 [Suillus lakei]|nr:hypothetical protein EDB19DRAFT_628512 [Suillus lakei]